MKYLMKVTDIETSIIGFVIYKLGCCYGMLLNNNINQEICKKKELKISVLAITCQRNGHFRKCSLVNSFNIFISEQNETSYQLVLQIPENLVIY